MGLIAGSDLVSIAPPNLPPEWTSTPNPSFVDGVGGTYDLDALDTFDPEADSLTYTLNGGSAAFPTGVTMDSAGLITGTNSVVTGTTSGILIDIDDGTNALVTSPSFSIIIANTITDQELRDLGFLLVDDYAGVDPTGSDDSLSGINQALLDGNSMEKPVWWSADAIYRVTDTVRFSLWSNSEQLVCRGGGGPTTSQSRPVIRLDNSAANFNAGGGAERPVVACRQFHKGGASFGDNPSDPMNNSGIYEGQANVFFDSVFEGIDIDCGTNTDAFGMYAPCAQRCYFGEIKITATNARGGWWGLGGRNSPCQNIEIVGGVWQIRNDARGAESVGGSCIAGLTLVGDSRTVTPIDTDDFVPMTIVGFKITQTEDISIWTSQSISRTGYGVLTLIDGEITIGGSSVVFDNANGHTFYARNVYISGTNNIVQSGSESTVTAAGTWKLINEYCYTDQTASGSQPGSNNYKTNSLIDGVVASTPEPATDIDASVSAPAVNFVTRHSMDMPSVDSGPFINIVDEGAVSAPDGEFDNDLYGDDFDQTTADSLAAIDTAIANAESAGHNRVFVPRGAYFVSAELDLRKDTIFIGVDGVHSKICVKDTWQPTSNVHVIRSADDATGTAHLSHVSVFTRVIDGTLASHTVQGEFDFFSWILWRTGKNSSSIQTVADRQFIKPEFMSGPKKRYSFSGNAGGKHYALVDAGGRAFGNADCRALLISGTSQPLHLYGVNMEISKSGAPDADTNCEILNSSNIRLYSNKREGDAQTFIITNCDNIAAYGFGRQHHKPSAAPDQTTINGSSTNILIAPSLFDQKDQGSTTDGMIKQDVDSPSGAVQVDYPEGVSLYKLGTIDDAAATI